MNPIFILALCFQEWETHWLNGYRTRLQVKISRLETWLGQCVVFLNKHFLSQCLSSLSELPGKSGEMLGGNLRIDLHPIWGGGGEREGGGDKTQLDGPLGTSTLNFFLKSILPQYEDIGQKRFFSPFFKALSYLNIFLISNVPLCPMLVLNTF